MANILKALVLICAFVAGGCNNGTPDASISQNEKAISLSFNSVINGQNIRKLDKLDTTKIIKEQAVSSGTVIMYSKQNDDENIYGAFKTTNAVYELGGVGGLLAQLDNESLSVDELGLFNKTIIRINGVFGANAPVQNYYSVEYGSILPFLRVDTGHATEIDLDGDGSVEIVSSHGTPIETYIYKWDGDKFSVANVNEALKATSVHLGKEKRFNASFEDGNTVEQFAYEAGKMRPIN